MSATEVGPPIDGLEYRRPIGSGGYADVFLYHDTSLDRDVAVKVVRETELSEVEASGFVAEAHAMAHLAHPHIVPVFSVGRTAHGRPYLTMPFYPEGTLSDRARRPLEVPEVLKTGIQIGSAVAYAHGAGILHRDIKPHNILRNQFGPALTDFGIAATIADVSERNLGVSVPWSPPEVLRDSAPASAASDVYSLAATLWHLLAAHAPFSAPDDTEAALVRRILVEPLPPLGRGDVPATLERLLRQAMAKDPGDRFSSMTGLVLALQDVQRQLRLEPTDVVLVPGRRRAATGTDRARGTPDDGRRDGSAHPSATRRRVDTDRVGTDLVPRPGPATPGRVAAVTPAQAGPDTPHGEADGATERRTVASEVRPGRPRTVVLLVLVVVMLAVLLLGVLMLVLGRG